jgi:hypothetical protein
MIFGKDNVLLSFLVSQISNSRPISIIRALGILK